MDESIHSGLLSKHHGGAAGRALAQGGSELTHKIVSSEQLISSMVISKEKYPDTGTRLMPLAARRCPMVAKLEKANMHGGPAAISSYA